MKQNSSKKVFGIVIGIALIFLIIAFIVNLGDGINGLIDSTDPDDDTTVETTTGTAVLDCKHASTTLGANGNTYCKTCNTLLALKAPVIAVSENTVTWGKIAEAESYSVYINGNMVKRVTANSYEFTASSSGEYTVTVKAEKDTVISAASNAHIFKVLASPVIKLNGDIVTWDAVEGADSYILYFDYEGLGWRVVDVIPNADDLTADELRFDLKELLSDTIVENSSVKIAVTAEDAGENIYTESPMSNQLTWTHIRGTYSVTKNITNGTLVGETSAKQGSTYTATMTASDYYFIDENSLTVTMGGKTLSANTDHNLIYGEEYTVTYEDAYAATIQIPGVSGNLVITASCVADILPAPTDIMVSGSKVTWTPVDSASSYLVKVAVEGESREFNATLTSFDILENGYTDSGEYEITVWARSPVGALGNAAIKTFTYLKIPVITDADGDDVSFKLNKDSIATSYNVYINDRLCESTLDMDGVGYYTITIPEEELQVGINHVYVIIYANGVSATSNTLTYTYNGAPSTGEESGPFLVNIDVTNGYACDSTSLAKITSMTVQKGDSCSFYVLSSTSYDFDTFTVTEADGTLLLRDTDYFVEFDPSNAPGITEGQQVALITIGNVTTGIIVTVTCSEQ